MLYDARQGDLLGQAPGSPDAPLPGGLIYQSDFLTEAEEAGLLALLRTLPFKAARYKRYEARRRVVGYGGRFDYDTNRLLPAAPLHEALWPLRARVAAWMQRPEAALRHALVSEYAPGTPLGWHRDVPDFEDIAGVSLGADATLRFRRWPHRPGRAGDTLDLLVRPRSIYRMGGEARWDWQHCVSPVQAPRWSITFRTLRGA